MTVTLVDVSTVHDKIVADLGLIHIGENPSSELENIVGVVRYHRDHARRKEENARTQVAKAQRIKQIEQSYLEEARRAVKLEDMTAEEQYKRILELQRQAEKRSGFKREDRGDDPAFF